MLNRRHNLLSLVSATVLLAALAAAAPAGVAPGGAIPSSPSPTERITLITGDRVTYIRASDGRERVVVDPALRRSGLPPTFTTRDDSSGYYVVPSDVQPSVEAGTLDRELFDVRDLAAADLDDSSSRALPVIATYQGRPGAAELNRAAGALPASTPAKALPSLASVALRVDRGQADDFWRAVDSDAGTGLGRGLKKLWLDAPVRATLAESVPQVGAPTVWQAGFDGQGVPVAVLDTGVDEAHPDLTGKVSASRNFTPDPTAADGNGHGTHVASTIAGTGAASGGARKGVAPGATIVSGKVLNNSGSGATSWILAGIEWAVQSGARVVNMSFSSSPTDGTDLLSQAVNTYTDTHGVLFVAAAGNIGPGHSTVSAPSVADAALSVGAVDKQDQMSFFSSRGPRRRDGAVKPEIVAPGSRIIAARAAGTDLGQAEGEHYTSLSGTSMAAPHVSGAAALLAQAHPDWRARELKSALVGAAKPIDATVFAQGAGRLDVARAFAQPVRGEPATVNYGSFSWPQSDDPPVVRTVTYSNHGAVSVTLALAVSARNLVGAEAAAGALQLSSGTVTVPAGGTASVDVTLDPRVGDAGAFAGALVATSPDGAVVVRTPLGYHKAVRTHRVTLHLKGSNGQPAGGAFDAVRLDGVAPSADPFVDTIFSIFPSGGVAEANLPAGVYDIAGTVRERTLTVDRTTFALESDVDLRHGDAEFVFDARESVLLRARTDERTQPFSMWAGYFWKLAERVGYGNSFLWGHNPGAEIRGIPSRKPPSPGRFTFETHEVLSSPMVSMRPTRGGGTLYPVYFQAPHSVARLDGNFSLPLVDVGDGDPEDFAGKDVAGKLGLVTLRPPATGNPFDYLFPQSAIALQNGRAAGVKALLFHLDVPGSVLFQPLPDVGLLELPVLSVHYDEGQLLRQLLARGPVELKVEANATLESTYHLHYDYPRGIPASQPGRVGRSDLARVPMRLHGDRPSLLNHLAFFAHTELPTGGAITTGVWGPIEHTAYLGPPSSRYAWDRVIFQTDNEQLFINLEAHDVYRKRGPYETESWFAGAFAPGSYDMAPDQRGLQFETLCGFCREGDLFLPTGYDFDDGSNWTLAPTFLHQVRMFAGDQELELRPLSEDFFGIGYFVLPPEPATYRLEDRSQDPRGGGREVRTAWTFRSAGRTAPNSVPEATFCVIGRLNPDASCRYEPLINLRYGLNVGLDNTVRGGRAHSFELSVAHHSQAEGAPIAGVAVAVSYDDGASWLPVRLRARHGKYVATVVHPKTGHVSIKTIAFDRAGNRVEQEVIRAYRLR